MKKSKLLNQPISALIAGLGHGDEIIVADCGLPIPETVHRIDLALKRGVPGFLETVATILEELEVEAAVVACEMANVNPDVHQGVTEMLAGVPITAIDHAEFRSRAGSARAIIRTGENTPYANVVLIAGVAF